MLNYYHLKLLPYAAIFRVMFSTAFILTGCFFLNAHAADRSLTIVLDPGHGGIDHGATGFQPVPEKAITLALAQKIETELKSSVHLILTRTGDTNIDLIDRGSTANSKGGDVFVSIHAGAGFERHKGQVTIFYYDDDLLYRPGGTTPAEKAKNQAIRYRNRLQISHQSQSKLMGKLIQLRLQNHIKERDISVTGAPIYLLEGIDMPAILIEICCISAPVQENRMTGDNVLLSELARGIAQGIKDFLSI